MTELIGKLYKKLWRNVDVNPWTENWWQIVIGFLLGILAGHFWW